jgi:hypothetical protein
MKNKKLFEERTKSRKSREKELIQKGEKMAHKMGAE